jgi:nitroimidazol reductase NimA-like FMN-containing flavoprotein (pyridoxamine 5'-phosphate oxidase superfamily)
MAVDDDRTGMETLDAPTCWALLRQAEVGRLAVSIQNHPDIFPINHVVDHGSIVFRTAEGTKLASAVLGLSVAYEVDGYEPGSGEAWSVVVKGRAVEIEQMHEVLEALDLPLFPWHASHKPRFVRIQPQEITGRRFHVVTGTTTSTSTTGARRAAPE